MKFFEHLDKKGGFYYERWGDAPVHSIGAALFAKKEQIVSVYVCSLHVFLSVSSYFFFCLRVLLATSAYFWSPTRYICPLMRASSPAHAQKY